MKGLLVLIAVLGVTLAFSSAAMANSVSCGHSATSCSNGQLGTPGGKPTTSGAGTLPFTGLDLAGIAAVGAVLLGSGLALQRTSRRRQQ